MSEEKKDTTSKKMYPFLVYAQMQCGDNAIPCESLSDALKVKDQMNATKQSNKLLKWNLAIYQQIPITSMSVTHVQAKQLYDYLHGKQDIPDLASTFLDEVKYYFPDIATETEKEIILKLRKSREIQIPKVIEKPNEFDIQKSYLMDSNKGQLMWDGECHYKEMKVGNVVNYYLDNFDKEWFCNFCGGTHLEPCIKIHGVPTEETDPNVNSEYPHEYCAIGKMKIESIE